MSGQCGTAAGFFMFGALVALLWSLCVVLSILLGLRWRKSHPRNPVRRRSRREAVVAVAVATLVHAVILAYVFASLTS